MNEPRWLTLHEVIAIHDKLIKRFGGPPGLRDKGALESALHRPVNRYLHERPDLAELGAAYAFGLARNHAFVDGNKRVAFAAMAVFLRLNGVAFAPEQPEAAAVINALAAGEIKEEGLAQWIKDNVRG